MTERSFRSGPHPKLATCWLILIASTLALCAQVSWGTDDVPRRMVRVAAISFVPQKLQLKANIGMLEQSFRRARTQRCGHCGYAGRRTGRIHRQ